MNVGVLETKCVCNLGGGGGSCSVEPLAEYKSKVSKSGLRHNQEVWATPQVCWRRMEHVTL
jgi:hypothetical protein